MLKKRFPHRIVPQDIRQLKTERASQAPQGEPTTGRLSFSEAFTPKLVTVFREGYGLDGLKADILSGLTVAIVAMPLSMAIAIASGTTPDRGLYAAIIGGFIVSLLGGSRFQIGGPAGAFIVLVAATVAQHGLDGLLLATLISGVLLLGVGFLRLGSYIQYIPYPVTVGFTAGIAVIIFASQLHDLMGLTLPGPEPGDLLPKLRMLAAALPSANAAAVAIAAGAVLVIVGLKTLRPAWPGMLIAVVLAALAATFLDLPVETIGSRFGGIPRGLPLPSLPELSPERILAVLPNAITFTLLGAIESLLSAVVADGMTGRRHRSNCELVAQGAANIGSALFGGICVTGTIARTVTNVRAGARGPVSGMLHSLFLLAFMLVAAPLASYIPLAALAGVLAVVAWNMIEKHAVRTLLLSSKGDALVLSVTFFLTIFRGLTEGIVVGFALGAALFIGRMAEATGSASRMMPVPRDRADSEGDSYDPSIAADRDVIVYRISGAFFFGAASRVGAALDRIADSYRVLVIDFSAVPLLDSTGANVLASVVARAGRAGARVVISGATGKVRRALEVHGVREPGVAFVSGVDSAMEAARAE